jgi:hypothetical protein
VSCSIVCEVKPIQRSQAHLWKGVVVAVVVVVVVVALWVALLVLL